MQDEELAKRLIGYADAVVAFAFVGISAFGIAIADPDIRCGLIGTKSIIAVIALIVGLLFTTILFALRRWERDLGGENKLSKKGQQYAGYLERGRFLMVWIAVCVSSLLVITIDTTHC